MLDFIRGILAGKTPVNAIIDCGGLGLEIRIPLSTYEKLPAVGEICRLFTVLSIGQDEIRVFGFITNGERQLFQKLTGIPGIGGKIGLSALSSLDTETFVKAIQRSDDLMISKVPGIGKKTAQRIIIELRDEILKLDLGTPVVQTTGIDTHLIEAESALLALGFSIKEINLVLRQMSDEQMIQPVEQIIKEAIKKLYQKRN
ncbi:MAG: Holliday junction branch migration protein RuvA [Candidatus Cloacimonetes bacterium]|nr:Holliday junction branch migration protein RuvA [Candidatus Cloacimonadota bacterium]